MPKYGCLIVEGPHDIEFAYRLLAPFGFQRVRRFSQLDEFFEPLVPRTFPPDDDMQKRVPVPVFLQSDSHAIALHSAVGDTNLINAIEEDANAIDFEVLTGVGIILDTDWDVSATVRYSNIKDEMEKLGFRLPDAPGHLSAGSPRFGAYVLPDNSNSGNLEELLLECASATFPGLLASARTHVENAKNDRSFKDPRREDLTKTSQFNKAIVGSIATVLRPGKAVQTSIQDNLWFRGANLMLPRVKAVQDFLVELFELS